MTMEQRLWSKLWAAVQAQKRPARFARPLLLTLSAIVAVLLIVGVLVPLLLHLFAVVVGYWVG